MLDAVESEIVDKSGKSAGNKEDKEDKKLTVEFFGTDLTKEYKDGFIDPIIGREKEIDQVIYTLLRKTKTIHFLSERLELVKLLSLKDLHKE